MSGILEFMAQFGEERRCIEYLATLRWPDGYVCSKCGGCEAWWLTSRPRVYQCTACAHQESVTSGTVFHRTRTPLPKWFLAAYLMGRDKRGVSAKFLERELEVAYQTAWSILHKLRHGLSEDPAQPLRGYLEADESYAGGRGDPSSPGRSLANPDKSLVVLAVEKKPAPKNQNGRHGHALQRQHGFYAGSARIAVLPAASASELGGFLKANLAAGSHLLTDGFAGYQGRKAALDEHLRHTPVIQDQGAKAAEFFPIVHTLFSTIKAWLIGTHHGVSAKHLPRYLREWAYRFNRRNLAKGIDRYLIRRAVECATITYKQLVAGETTAGATRFRRLPRQVAEAALAG
ncbi:MAG: IS1595 family transposase [Rhizobiales bacterium]|nr:IS1595 family transposase [Hyphomicrobiales bacterium]